MKYYVWWSTGQYDGDNLSVFGIEQKVIELLNKYAGNSDFEFKVIYGKEVNFKAVKTATVYKRDEGAIW